MRTDRLERLNKILSIVALSLVILLVTSTVTAFAIKKDNIGNEYRKADPSPQKVKNMSKGKEDNVDAFTDFKQIRIQTKAESEDSEPTVIVVCPWFSFPAGDQQLFEELSQKERQMRGIFVSYFSSMTSAQILSKGESLVKEELLEEINSQLVMGKIRAVYFNDYIFIN